MMSLWQACRVLEIQNVPPEPFFNYLHVLRQFNHHSPIIVLFGVKTKAKCEKKNLKMHNVKRNS